MSFETQPLEEARIGRSSRNKRRDKLPTLSDVMNLGDRDRVFLTMFADEPDENFQVTDAPVPLKFACLRHST